MELLYNVIPTFLPRSPSVADTVQEQEDIFDTFDMSMGSLYMYMTRIHPHTSNSVSRRLYSVVKHLCGESEAQNCHYVTGGTFPSTFRVVGGHDQRRCFQESGTCQQIDSGLLHDSSNSVLCVHELLRRPRSRLRFACSSNLKLCSDSVVSCCLTTTARLAPDRLQPRYYRQVPTHNRLAAYRATS